ncbi:MAG TPA: DUF1837 domain-containing protein [Gammaproteobacteria bacterium]
MADNILHASRVITEHSCTDKLRVYYVGFEQKQFRLDALVEIITGVIPEFVFGSNVTTVANRDLTYRVRESAKRLYETDKYQRRGEFGEVILHLLLSDFVGTVPLLSKIYFKDSMNATVHGFDGVHVLVKGEKRQLWLGESKLYDDGAAGVAELAKDIVEHFKTDYLRSEFLLLSDRIAEDTPDIQHWKELLHQHTVLDKILNEVWVPCVCTYSGSAYDGNEDICEKFTNDLNTEVERLEKKFSEELEKVETKLNVILILFPVKNKAELVTALHDKVQAWRDL